MNNFKIGDVVKVVKYGDKTWKYLGQVGTVTDTGLYIVVEFSDSKDSLYLNSELELAPAVVKNPDVTGREINVGDTIVYFYRGGSGL